MKEDGSRYRIESVWQAGQVLKAVAEAKGPLSATEIAQRTGATVNAAYRTCLTLEELGFLMAIGERYELGMGLALFWARKKTMLESERERVVKDLKSIEEGA